MTSTEFSLDALTPTDAEMPATTRSGGRSGRPNPFSEWLLASYETNTAKAVTVPAGAVQEVIYAIRAAANAHGIGSRIAMQDGKGNRVDAEMVDTKDINPETGKPVKRPAVVKEDGTEARGQIRVTFLGKKRKQRTEKSAENTPAPVETTTQ